MDNAQRNHISTDILYKVRREIAMGTDILDPDTDDDGDH
jgi:hypothetical protein